MGICVRPASMVMRRFCNCLKRTRANPLQWAVLVCVRAGLPPMKGERMSFALRRNLARRLLLVLAPALAACATAFAQAQPAAPTSFVFAINEGGAANADAADILFR